MSRLEPLEVLTILKEVLMEDSQDEKIEERKRAFLAGKGSIYLDGKSYTKQDLTDLFYLSGTDN